MYLVDDLGRIADALLVVCERDPTAPFWTEPGMRRRLEIDRRREPLLKLPRNDDMTPYLLRKEWASIVARANLTFLQRHVLERRLSGWTFEEIGRSRGRSRQSAKKLFGVAVEKLLAAWAAYPFAGLAESYRQDLARGRRR